MPIAPGSLKCVTVCSSTRPLLPLIEAALRSRLSAADVRRLGESAVLVHTDAAPADIRDWLAPLLEEGESLLVVEFEKWSAYGTAADRDWLLARGH